MTESHFYSGHRKSESLTLEQYGRYRRLVPLPVVTYLVICRLPHYWMYNEINDRIWKSLGSFIYSVHLVRPSDGKGLWMNQESWIEKGGTYIFRPKV